MTESSPLSRRGFLRTASAAAAAVPFAAAAQAVSSAASEPASQNKVDLPQLKSATEQPEQVPGPLEPRAQRVGYAVVGLGRLSLSEILPAMGRSKYCRAVALVSGDRDKAMKVAAQYDIKPTSIYDYTTYDQLAANPEVQVIYIVLPNSMHAEYTVRGAKAGKHILCEKPMANSVKDCERMIAACNAANVKLMIAYRSQYEPNDLALQKMIREGKLGKLRQMIANNSQDQGDPQQWRQKLALAGGGALPDVGIYCLNAARFLSNEEPYEVLASTTQPKNDPRFAEVEASCQVIARFPSGFTAAFNTSYDAHTSRYLRIQGSDAWAEMNPAFAYHGIKLRVSRLVDGHETTFEPGIEEKDQFAAEMDHMSLCVQRDIRPRTPGEEGLQDQRIVEAIYAAARTGRAVRIAAPAGPTRGPDPSME